MLVNRFTGKLDSQLLENGPVHRGEHHGGVHLAAFQLGELFQRFLCHTAGCGRA